MFELPELPAGIVTLVSVLSPYVISLISSPAFTPMQKRVVSVLGSLLVSAVAMWLFYALGGGVVPEMPQLLLLGLLVSQATYALIAKPLGAKAIESRVKSPLLRGRYADRS